MADFSNASCVAQVSCLDATERLEASQHAKAGEELIEGAQLREPQVEDLNALGEKPNACFEGQESSFEISQREVVCIKNDASVTQTALESDEQMIVQTTEACKKGDNPPAIPLVPSEPRALREAHTSNYCWAPDRKRRLYLEPYVKPRVYDFFYSGGDPSLGYLKDPVTGWCVRAFPQRRALLMWDMKESDDAFVVKLEADARNSSFKVIHNKSGMYFGSAIEKGGCEHREKKYGMEEGERKDYSEKAERDEEDCDESQEEEEEDDDTMVDRYRMVLVDDVNQAVEFDDTMPLKCKEK